jgi:hypothetical protein
LNNQKDKSSFCVVLYCVSGSYIFLDADHGLGIQGSGTRLYENEVMIRIVIQRKIILKNNVVFEKQSCLTNPLRVSGSL